MVGPTFFFNSYVSIVALDATMATRKISLGPNELRLLFELEKERKSAFSIDDAKRILGESGPSVKNVLYRLKKKGRIDDLEKRMLSFQARNQVPQAAFCVKDQANLVAALLVWGCTVLLAQVVGGFQQLVVKPVGDLGL